ncbi:MAG: alpha/beta fold hydrolase [Novosphingobium sp.]
MADTQFHVLPDGRRIAYRHTSGAGPTLVFLPGYMSDMAGGKAQAVFAWAKANRRACLLLDYSGCGESSGLFADGALGRWQEEILSLIGAVVADRVILIGSSMGGWLMLLAGLELGERLAGLIGIAPAPDFTDWGYSAEQKADLAAGRPIYEANPYGPDPTPTHPRFWADGQGRRLLGRPIAITCPVRLLQGQQDPDVPWRTALTLAEALESQDVRVHLIKDGDHRLSRDQDIALLLGTVAGL